MPQFRCPQCDTLFDTATTPAMPFCSRRCKLIDLGRWLSEENSVPYEPDPDDLLDEFSDEEWN